MEEVKDVVLNVYKLAANDGPEQQSRSASFFSRMLPAIGFGAYHTSLELDGYTYTFAAGAGIVKSSTSSRRQHQGIPVTASFQEAIPLGSCRPKNRGQVNAIVKILGELYFTPTSYHLLHRNCNHFTETFATALILYDELVDFDTTTTRTQRRLPSYPVWVNRLASAGAVVVSQHDADIVPCNVLQEAAKAVGADRKVGWNLPNNTNSGGTSATTTNSKPSSGSSTTKKELTDAQKKALAKIRKK